jgi:hypothetical protein
MKYQASLVSGTVLYTQNVSSRFRGVAVGQYHDPNHRDNARVVQREQCEEAQNGATQAQGCLRLLWKRIFSCIPEVFPDNRNSLESGILNKIKGETHKMILRSDLKLYLLQWLVTDSNPRLCWV